MNDIFLQANRVRTAQRQSSLSMTTPSLLKTRTALQHSRPQCLRVWKCARKISLLYMRTKALGRDCALQMQSYEG